MNVETLVIPFFLAFFIKTVVDLFKKAVKMQYPSVNGLLFLIASWVVGLAVVLFSGYNAFDQWIYSVWLGRVLTGLAAAGIANFGNDLVKSLSNGEVLVTLLGQLQTLKGLGNNQQ